MWPFHTKQVQQSNTGATGVLTVENIPTPKEQHYKTTEAYMRGFIAGQQCKWGKRHATHALGTYCNLVNPYNAYAQHPSNDCDLFKLGFFDGFYSKFKGEKNDRN